MMKHQYKNAWFTNFSGIGNGIIVIPILKCFEGSYPTVNYYHTENPVLADQWFLERAGLKKLKGFSPIAWRRFKEEDWQEINSFIKDKNIDLIVNLRNEGPKYDSGYYRFKEKLHKENASIKFWDLNFEIIEHRQEKQNLTKDILKLVKEKGVDIDTYNPRWLRVSHLADTHRDVGFGMAASQSNKRWLADKWIKLAHHIVTNLGEHIILIPGQSKKEIEDAKLVLASIGDKKCSMVLDKSVANLVLRISKLKTFVSNDTGFLHIASAAGIPTIGLYVSTNPEVWSPYDKTDFYAFKNSFFERCSDPKSHCGNCFHYYDICPAIEKFGDDIDPDNIYKVISQI